MTTSQHPSPLSLITTQYHHNILSPDPSPFPVCNTCAQGRMRVYSIGLEATICDKMCTPTPKGNSYTLFLSPQMQALNGVIRAEKEESDGMKYRLDRALSSLEKSREEIEKARMSCCRDIDFLLNEIIKRAKDIKARKEETVDKLFPERTELHRQVKASIQEYKSLKADLAKWTDKEGYFLKCLEKITLPHSSGRFSIPSLLSDDRETIDEGIEALANARHLMDRVEEVLHRDRRLILPLDLNYALTLHPSHILARVFHGLSLDKGRQPEQTGNHGRSEDEDEMVRVEDRRRKDSTPKDSNIPNNEKEKYISLQHSHELFYLINLN